MDFLDAVSDYITLKKENQFFINCFSDKEKLNNYLINNKDVDLVIISPDMIVENIKQKYVIWCDNAVDNKYKEHRLISKYISGDALISEISAYLYENRYYISDKKLKANLVSFFSPCGGVGKTTISINLARQAARKGYKTLYINMEDFNSMSLYFQCKGRSFSEGIYYAIEESNDLKSKYDRIICSDIENLYYFCPVESYKDFYSLNNTAIKNMFDTIKKYFDFELIILDISICYSPIIEEILYMSNIIVVPLYQNRVSMYKMNVLANEISIIENDKNIRLNIIPVINRYKKDCLSPFNQDVNIKIPDKEDNQFEASINLLLKEVLDNEK